MKDPSYAVIMKVIDTCGTVHSRLKLQKMFYALRSLGFPVRERFKFKAYGPFSHKLATELETAVRLGWLDEREVTRGAPEPGADPYVRYDIKRTPKTVEFLDNIPDDWRGQFRLDEIGEVSKQLNQYSPEELELVATLMYVQDVGVKADPVKYVRSLKPKFTEEQVRWGLEEVKKVRASFTAKSKEATQ